MTRRLLLVLLAAALAVATAAAYRALLEPDVVWCPVEEGGAVHSFRTAPDGDEIAHGATMSAPDASWAYCYPRPSALRSLLASLGWNDPGTTDFVATGRETTTPSGRWIEMRRLGGGELVTAVSTRR